MKRRRLLAGGVLARTLQGKVTVDGKPVTKAGTQIGPASKVVINAEEPK